MKSLKMGLIVVLTNFVIYLILFLLSSFLWQDLRIDNNLSLGISIALSIIFYGYACYRTKLKFKQWFIGIFVMYILACLYHPHNCFGIDDGITSANFDALIFSFGYLGMQFLTYNLVNIFRKLKTRTN